MSHASDISVLHDHDREGDPGDRGGRRARDWGTEGRPAGRRFSRDGHHGGRSAEDWLADNRTPAARPVSRGAARASAARPWSSSSSSSAGASSPPEAAAFRAAVARDAAPRRRALAPRDAAAPRHDAADVDPQPRRTPEDRVVEDWLAAGGTHVDERDRTDAGDTVQDRVEPRDDRVVEDWLAAGGRSAAPRRPAGERRPRTTDWVADAEHRRVELWLAGGRSAQVAAAADELDPDALPVPDAPTLELELPLGATRPARRTVTVTGHPDAVRRAQRAGEIARRRPAPSLDARLTHRPDRIAMWACAMGLLLVIVAIATEHA